MRVITCYLWLSLEIGKQISMSKDKLKEESWLSLAWDGVTISRSSFIKLGRLIHACRNVVAAFNPCCCCWCSSAYRVVGEENKKSASTRDIKQLWDWSGCLYHYDPLCRTLFFLYMDHVMFPLCMISISMKTMRMCFQDQLYGWIPCFPVAIKCSLIAVSAHPWRPISPGLKLDIECHFDITSTFVYKYIYIYIYISTLQRVVFKPDVVASWHPLHPLTIN